jgi:predicted enzyme related to lactoylglutathione lyase
MGTRVKHPDARATVPPVSGAPCWVNLSTRDLEAAQHFYAQTLGWSFRKGSLGPDFCVALSDEGVPVAGMGAVARSMGVGVEWTPFFAVPDANLAAARVSERGATVAVGPIQMGGGRTALAADTSGATFGFWEGEVLQSWHVAETSPPARLELRTRDAFAAAIFYGEVFEWAKGEGHCEVDYRYDRVIVRVGGRPVATLSGGADEAAPSARFQPRWEVSFHVRDVDAAVQAAVAAGGVVIEPPAETPLGRAAGLRDPEGGLFVVTSGETAAES